LRDRLSAGRQATREPNLAFAPWRDDAKRYIQAFVEGRIPEYFGQPGDPSDDAVREIRRRPRETLEDRARRYAADLAAGRNPRRDGTPYEPEEKS
jgi:hypothetical protein